HVTIEFMLDDQEAHALPSNASDAYQLPVGDLGNVRGDRLHDESPVVGEGVSHATHARLLFSGGPEHEEDIPRGVDELVPQSSSEARHIRAPCRDTGDVSLTQCPQHRQRHVDSMHGDVRARQCSCDAAGPDTKLQYWAWPG